MKVKKKYCFLLTLTDVIYTLPYYLLEFDTHYKLFLAAILLASKYIEDHNRLTKSIYRAVAPLYGPRDLAEMERSFLAIVSVSQIKWARGWGRRKNYDAWFFFSRTFF